MKAVFKTGGKQYYAEEGTVLYVEKLPQAEGEKVTFSDVLFVDGNMPSSNALVEAKVVKHGKNRKLKIFKYVNKNNKHRKTQGHRQPYTKIEITKVVK